MFPAVVFWHFNTRTSRWLTEGFPGLDACVTVHAEECGPDEHTSPKNYYALVQLSWKIIR